MSKRNNLKDNGSMMYQFQSPASQNTQLYQLKSRYKKPIIHGMLSLSDVSIHQDYSKNSNCIKKSTKNICDVNNSSSSWTSKVTKFNHTKVKRSGHLVANKHNIDSKQSWLVRSHENLVKIKQSPKYKNRESTLLFNYHAAMEEIGSVDGVSEQAAEGCPFNTNISSSVDTIEATETKTMEPTQEVPVQPYLMEENEYTELYPYQNMIYSLAPNNWQYLTEKDLMMKYWFYLYIETSKTDELLQPFDNLLLENSRDKRMKNIIDTFGVKMMLRDVELYKSLPRWIVFMKAKNWNAIAGAIVAMEGTFPDMMRYAVHPNLMQFKTFKFGCIDSSCTAPIVRTC